MKNLRLFWKGFKEGSKKFSHKIADMVNFILLSLVYFVGVGITSLLAKIFKKHFLNVKLDQSRHSYWEPLNLGKKSKEDYYRQF